MKARCLTVPSSAHPYSVRIGAGQLAGLGALLTAELPDGRVAVVTDDTVLPLWGKDAVRSLEEAGRSCSVFSFPAGENQKTLARAEWLYGKLIEERLGRADTLIAVGGGVVGDLGGFVAATYHRGMRLVHVPTTLLAQVDSSIGGKVAVDHPLGKNLVGAFFPPRLVVTDPATLSTLPLRERWSGLAEVVKAALIADAQLVTQLEGTLESLGEGTADVDELSSVIGRAVEIKADVVTRDEHEQDVRLHLNFGHTLGHALETATGYGPLTHGEAVVIGMRAALRISQRLGHLSGSDATRALALLARFPAPPGPVPRPSREALRAAFFRDKKAKAGRVRFVVLQALGRAALEPALSPALLEQGFELVLEGL